MTWNFNETLEAHKKTPIPCLRNRGYVKLIDASGSDQLIARAARVSRSNQDKDCTEEADAELISNLMRWQHTTPFEFATLTFEVKCPIFIARQWMRHRTFSYMERSGRYGATPLDHYIPLSMCWAPDMDEFSEKLKSVYDWGFNEDSVENEELRAVLPLGTFTTFWFKADLHNLFHFLKLRLSKGAQIEIQEYASAIYRIVKSLFPLSARAFDNYCNKAKTISRDCSKIIKKIIEQTGTETVQNIVIETFPDDDKPTQVMFEIDSFMK